jgi:hypothetical protein
MTDLANTDQALKLEWEKTVRELAGSMSFDDLVLEYGRRVLKMAEGKEALSRMLNEPGADAPLK